MNQATSPRAIPIKTKPKKRENVGGDNATISGINKFTVEPNAFEIPGKKHSIFLKQTTNVGNDLKRKSLEQLSTSSLTKGNGTNEQLGPLRFTIKLFQRHPETL
jgi:hypothetical protein